MHRSGVLLLGCLLLVVVVGSSLVVGMPAQCSPEVLEEIDNPKIREICRFLQQYAEAMESGGVNAVPYLKGTSWQ